MGVVVTGCGVISGAGCGRGAFAAALAGGSPRWEVAAEHPLLPPLGRGVPVALADEAELSQWVEPRLARRMSRPSKLMLAAARMATAEAGLDRDTLAADPTATIVATAFGTAAFAEELVKAIEVEPQSASPFHFSESVANAPAAQVAIQLGARGTNVAITQREAGPWLALGAGVREVSLGRARYAVVGAVDELNPLVLAVLARFRATARIGANGPVCSPFDRSSTGFLPAEGGICLILEDESSAHQRSAPILARVLGVGRGFDPSADPWSWGQGGQELAGAIGQSLGAIGLDAETLSGWSANASGARPADAVERDLLEALFANRRLPLLATPKRIVGEYGGLALAAAICHLLGTPVVGSSTWDGPAWLKPSTGTLPAGPLLSLALASGGAAAWAVLAGPDGLARV